MFNGHFIYQQVFLACFLALSWAAEKSANEENSLELAGEEQRYGRYGGGYGGRRYGRSVAEETQELAGQEQRYGRYGGGYGGRRYGRSTA